MKNKDMNIDYDYRKNIKKIENDEIEKINEIEKDYIMKSKIFFDSARKTVDEVFPKHNNASKAKLYIFNKILLIFKKN